MASVTAPLLVDVLVRLSLNWHIAKSRYDRDRDNYRKEVERLERQVRCLDRQQSKVANTKRKALKRKYNAKINEVKSKAELLDAAYHLHPFPDFVARITRWTGAKRETIRKAAMKEFSGYPKLVAKLEQLDGHLQTQRLYQQLIRQHETLAIKIGLPPQSLSVTETNKLESIEKKLQSMDRQMPRHESTRDKLRKQRTKFATPLRAKGKTWQDIYIAYHKRYPRDAKASADVLRLACTRNKAAG